MSTEDKERQKRDDVQWVLSTEQGRRFMWELLGVCGVYRSLEGEPNSMLVQEGARRIGLHLIGIITDADELLYVKMMLESRNRTLEETHGNSRKPDTDESDYTTSSDSEFEYDYTTSGYDSGESLPEYDSSLGQFL